MVLTVLLLTLLAVVVCIIAARKALALLRLDLVETLFWLGIAEAVPERRERPALRVVPAP